MEKELIGRLNIVLPEVNVISGNVARKGGVEAGSAFTDGQVHYLDRAHLRPFNSGRAAMQRICRQRGVRFLSGYAVPDESLPAVLDALRIERQKIEGQIKDFLDAMPQHMEDWKAAHPEIGPWEGDFPTVDYARRRMGVSVGVFKITPDAAAGDDVIHEAGGLAGRALEEVALDVRLSWDPKIPEVTQKARGIFRRAITKLRSLAVIDPMLAEVADAVDQVLTGLPNEGRISGSDFIVLNGLANSLSSAASMTSMAQQLKVVAPADLWGVPADSTPEPTPVTDAEPEKVKAEPETPPVVASSEAWSW